MGAGLLMTSACAPTPTRQTLSPSPSASAGAPATSPGTTAVPEGAVTVTRDLFGTQIQLTVHPVKVSGGIAALTIDYELVGQVSSSLGGTVSLFMVLMRGAMDEGPSAITLVDLPNRVAYSVLGSQGNTTVGSAGYSDFTKASPTDYAAQNYIDNNHPSTSSVTLFDAPKASSVGVLVGNFGYVDDVPVVPGGITNEEAVAAPKGVDSTLIGHYTQPMQLVQIAYAEDVTTKQQDQTVTISVDSDVLFATDQYTLSPDAQAALNSAVAQIQQAAASGAVQVIGHTDDVGTDAYNQTLSENRAQTVATALTAALGSRYTVTSKGVGKSDPAVQGTNDAARAANRRVEITLQGQMMSQTQQTTTTPVTGIPDSTAPTVAGAGNWVQYQTWGGRPAPVDASAKAQSPTFAVKADQVVRNGVSLIGTFDVQVQQVGGGMLSLVNALNSDAAGTDLGKRGYGVIGNARGAMAMALLTDQGRVYPYNYDSTGIGGSGQTGSTGSTATCDVNIYTPGNFAVGDVAHVTVIWPDTGQKTVSVEVPGAFRITDIPVQ